MQVHPDIAALRANRAPQRQAQGAMAEASRAWREEPGAADFADELKHYGEGAALADCPQLSRVFAPAGDGMHEGEDEAQRLIGLMVGHYCRAMASHPLAHPPFRNGFDGRIGSLLLARAGRAHLLLHTREPGRYQHKDHLFRDEERHDVVLAGHGEGRLVHIEAQARADRPARDGGSGDGRDGQSGTAVRFAIEPITLKPRARRSLDLNRSALAIDRVERRLVMLRLQRGAADPGMAREYDANTGALVQQSAPTLAISRKEAIVALLGRMARADAAPTMARLALAPGDTSLRWQALRECLALDTAQGFAALADLARRSDDPLGAPAGALRAQLLETYPQLHQLETSPCPA